MSCIRRSLVQVKGVERISAIYSDHTLLCQSIPELLKWRHLPQHALRAGCGDNAVRVFVEEPERGGDPGATPAFRLAAQRRQARAHNPEYDAI